VARGSRCFRALDWYYSQAYRRADLIAVLSPAAADVVAEKGVERGRILFLPNGADPELLAAGDAALVRRQHQLEGKFVALYAGSFSEHYKIMNIVSTAELLSHDYAWVHFVLLGAGPDWKKVAARLRSTGLRNITLLSPVPREQLGSYLKAADLFLSSFPRRPSPRPYRGVVSAKACDYMLAGRPILSIEDGLALGELLQQTGAGRIVAPGTPGGLAAGVLHYAKNQSCAAVSGRAAHAYATQHLLREHVVASFEGALLAQIRRLEQSGAVS
jgi:glycosyltransferase involved in cell wall biosynthesis